MRFSFLSVLGITSIMFFGACTYTSGEGPVVEKEFTLDAFTGVEMDGSFDVQITQGAAQKVVVATQENIMEKVKLSVVDGILYVSLEPGSYFNYELTVKLTMTTVDRIVLSGSGDINVGTFVGLEDLTVKLDGSGDIKENGPLEVNGLANIELDGSGDIELKMKAKEVAALLDGSGDIKLSGSADKLDVKLEGSGDIHAYDMESINCIARLDGSGNIKVFASKHLEADLRGSGDIDYKGSPQVKANIDGSGSIDSH